MRGVREDTAIAVMAQQAIMANCSYWSTVALVVLLMGLYPTATSAQSGTRSPGSLGAGSPAIEGPKKGPRLSNPVYITEESGTPQDRLVDVKVQGNTTIPTSEISKYVRTRPGRPANRDLVLEDVRALFNTHWFFSVEPRYKQTPEGLVLIYKVRERPMVRNVEYRGNEKIKTKYLAALTGLKRGSPLDPTLNREAVRRIKEHYFEKGFTFAEVELLEGGELKDRDVIFQIKEGPKVRVISAKFIGNKEISDRVLRTKLRTKRALLYKLGGLYDPTTVKDDLLALREYYQNLGYFDIEINHKTGFSKDRSQVTLEFHINEGKRYRIRDIKLIGNTVLNEQFLRQEFETKAGSYFNARYVNQDLSQIKNEYGNRGYLFADIQPIPKFDERSGIVDLVYNINEDKPYRIRRVNVQIQGDGSHTRRSVVDNRLLFASGQLADADKIERSKRRLAQPIFEPNTQINIRRVPSNQAPRPFELASEEVDIRGQDPNPNPPPANPIFPYSPQGDPFGNALQAPPDQGWVDVDVLVNEAQTGRLMFGVGVNSDAGVVGSIVLEEQNFDLFRPPRSFRDIVEGTAWRGGGQRFRLEAVPGDQVSRYSVSWTDPYIFDTNYSLGVSGFYFNRFFPDWDEQRGGGRVTLGRNFTQEWSASMTIRLETIELENPTLPTPTVLQEAIGNSFLSTVGLSVAHDTRDNAFMATEGHFAQISYQQAFGDFNYPRFDAEASRYFTVWSRPDGGGKHVFSMRGQVGWTDSDTPIFERYYAGGFQTFRGFEFRGITPRDGNVGIGGRFLTLGSLEYKLPVTADDNVAVVAFSDFGTVEESVSLDNFRVSVGAGLRLAVPIMGPVPLAFDFAVPITDQENDETQVFSFYIGITR